MTALKFNDGMEFDTSGKLRTEKRSDGFYVVGDGRLVPVKDQAEALALIKQLNPIKAVDHITHTAKQAVGEAVEKFKLSGFDIDFWEWALPHVTTSQEYYLMLLAHHHTLDEMVDADETRQIANYIHRVFTQSL